MEKGTFLHFWLVCNLEISITIPQNTQTEVTFDLDVYLLDTFLKALIASYHSDIFIPMFIVAEFIITKYWETSIFTSREGWIKKLCYLYTEYYSSIKKYKTELFVGKKIHLEIIILSKINPTQKFKSQIVSLV